MLRVYRPHYQPHIPQNPKQDTLINPKPPEPEPLYQTHYVSSGLGFRVQVKKKLKTLFNPKSPHPSPLKSLLNLFFSTTERPTRSKLRTMQGVAGIEKTLKWKLFFFIGHVATGRSV